MGLSVNNKQKSDKQRLRFQEGGGGGGGEGRWQPPPTPLARYVSRNGLTIGGLVLELLLSFQLSKSDGIWGFQFGNQRLVTSVHGVFEFKNRTRISFVECNLVSYCQTKQVM